MSASSCFVQSRACVLPRAPCPSLFQPAATARAEPQAAPCSRRHGRPTESVGCSSFVRATWDRSAGQPGAPHAADQRAFAGAVAASASATSRWPRRRCLRCFSTRSTPAAFAGLARCCDAAPNRHRRYKLDRDASPLWAQALVTLGQTCWPAPSCIGHRPLPTITVMHCPALQPSACNCNTRTSRRLSSRNCFTCARSD